MQKSDFIPNTFVVPNAYVDRLMSYLTDPELRVLLYAARRIFGFQKRQDNIALSQFTEGIKDKDGNTLDEGAGISLDTARKAIACLIQFNIMNRVSDNPRPTDGDLYELQLDSNAVDWTALRARRDAKQAQGKARMQAARAARKDTPIYGGDGTEDTTGKPLLSHKTGLVPQNDTPLVPQNATPLVGQKHNIQRNPEKSSVRQPKTPGARDPRLDHPAIMLVRATLRRYPDKGAWDSIIEALGENPDGERFKQVYATWTLRGFKPTNLEGLLNWYKNGIPEYQGKYSAPAQAPAPQYEFVYLEE